jgi:hypothetical protein
MAWSVPPLKYCDLACSRNPFDIAGYGATTLPALTEALTIDKNVTAAAREVDRLVYLAHKLSETLRAQEGFSPSHGDAEN